MDAVSSHPPLYDALREAGASERRARAAEQSIPSAAQVASKSEVRSLGDKLFHAVKVLTAITIANFFFAAGGLYVYYDSHFEIKAEVKTLGARVDALHLEVQENRMAIQANTQAIAENRKAIEANAKAIEANAQAIAENRKAIEANAIAIEANAIAIADNAKAIAENRAAIQANSDKLDEILRLLRTAEKQ